MYWTEQMRLTRQGMPQDEIDYASLAHKSGGGGGKSESTTKSKPHQQAQYDRLLGESGKWLNQGGFDPNYGGSAGFNPNAPMTAQQRQALGGLSGGAQDIQGLLSTQGMQSLDRSLGAYDPEASGLNAAISAANRGLQRDFAQTTLPAIGAGAQNTGQYGSTRHGIAQGIAGQGLADAMTANAQNLAFQDYQNFQQQQAQTLGNLSNISKGLLSGSAAQYDAGSLEQQQQQQQINADLQKWAYENNVDLNTLLAYKQLISGDMGGVNTTETEGGGSGGGGWMSAVGSIGGSALGGMMGGGGGGGGGGGLLF